MNSLIKIEVWWQGPYKWEDIKSMQKSKDYGVYQIYGTHNVNGPNALLYIGQAVKRKFGTRILEHNWTEWEYSNVEIYVGRLGGIKDISIEEWERQIAITERLLIYYCKPPYNTVSINNYGE